MRKIAAWILCAALALSLAACAAEKHGGADPSDPPEESGDQNPGEEADNPGEEEKPEDGNTPDDGDKPEDGNTPDDGEKPEDGNAPEDGDKPEDGNTPDDGDKPEDGNTPDDGDKPEDGNTPEDGEDPDEEGGQPTTPVPGFPGGIGGIGGIGGSGQDEAPEVPVTDAGDLVDKLDALCQGIVSGSFTESLRSSAAFANYFDGKLQYTEGMRVATNLLQMAPPAHIVMLIEAPQGVDAQAYAKELMDNANPRWMVCAVAQSVQTAVKDNLILFVMSSTENADALVAAFNG